MNNSNKILGLVAILFAGEGYAQDQSKSRMSLGLGLEYDDNVNRAASSEDEKSDTSRNIEFLLDVRGESKHMAYRAEYIGSNTTYFHDAYNSRSSVFGSGELVFFTNDRNFSWTFSNRERDTVVDVLEPDTPDNRQQRSVFSTGPDVTLNVSSRDAIYFSGRYSEVEVDQGLGSDRVNGELGWSHDLSPKTRISINFMHEDVEFDEESGGAASLNDYSSNYGALGLSRRYRYGYISANAGYSEIERDNFNESAKSPTYNLDVIHNAAGGTTALNASRSLTDSSVGLDGGRANLDFLGEEDISAPIDVGVGSNIAAIILQKFASISHQRSLFSNMNQIEVSLFWNEREEEASSLVESLRRLEVEYERQVSPSLVFNVAVGAGELEREDDLGKIVDRRKSFSLTFTKELSERLSYECGYAYVDRDSKLGRTFNSNTLGCQVSYDFL